MLAGRERVYLPARDGRMEERRVTFGAVFGKFALLGLEGIETREQAQGLGGRTIYLAREDIPVGEGEVLIADLIGAPVTDARTGRVYGRCASITDGALYPLIAVETGKGEVILPDIPEFIQEKDPDRGIFVTPIPGFFEEA